MHLLSQNAKFTGSNGLGKLYGAGGGTGIWERRQQRESQKGKAWAESQRTNKICGRRSFHVDLISGPTLCAVKIATVFLL